MKRPRQMRWLEEAPRPVRTLAPGAMAMRAARERKAHEKRKNAPIPKVVAAVRLRRMK